MGQQKRMSCYGPELLRACYSIRPEAKQNCFSSYEKNVVWCNTTFSTPKQRFEDFDEKKLKKKEHFKTKLTNASKYSAQLVVWREFDMSGSDVLSFQLKQPK